MRKDLMLEVTSKEASEMGWAVGPLGVVSHDGTSWCYERFVGPSKEGRGYESHLAAQQALLDALTEVGEPDALLATRRSEA
jgi:hypothetical protein